jgi:hypothetical protein
LIEKKATSDPDIKAESTINTAIIPKDTAVDGVIGLKIPRVAIEGSMELGSNWEFLDYYLKG